MKSIFYRSWLLRFELKDGRIDVRQAGKKDEGIQERRKGEST